MNVNHSSLALGQTLRAVLFRNWLQIARVSWIVLALAAMATLVAAWPGYTAKFAGQLSHATGNAVPPGAHFFAAASGVASLASALLSLGLSALLFRYKFKEPIAALLSFFLLVYGIVMSGPLELASAHWLGSVESAQAAQSILLATPTIALFMLFPTGQFVPGWTRWLVLLSLPWSFASLLVSPYDGGSVSRDPALSAMIAGVFVSFFLAGVYAQIYRYRNTSTPTQRRQTRWAIYGFTLWVTYILFSSIPYFYLTGLQPDAPTPWWGPASELGWWLSLNILPVCLTIAITRHQLWNIDRLVRRTLVYGALTASVVGLYVLLVGGLGWLFQARGNPVIGLLATGLVAVLFQPLRQRLQQAVDRLFYGRRDDPLDALAQLGQRMEAAIAPDVVLSTLVETVAQTLKLPYVAIRLHTPQGAQIMAQSGAKMESALRLPLVYQGQTLGELLTGPRAAGEPLSGDDRRLLAQIARQAGPAVHAVQLTAALQASRRQLVTAREEERRRLRRDLHDGLGAALAGLHLQTGVLRRLIDSDPQQAQALVDEFRADIRTTIDEIRRVVYELRPPTLDQLGLVAAVRAQAAHTQAAQGETTLQVQIEAPEDLPPLPAAVEVAALRIAQEALTNVVHHAQARCCRVRLEINGDPGAGRDLCLEIVDDGIGLAREKDGRQGLGLLSMRERAMELGGACLIEEAPGGGTRVLARLPLALAAPRDG